MWAPDTVSTMPASNTPGAPSPFPTVANFRDLGHWAGDGGRVVAPGALYRANDFATLDDDDRAGLSGLGLRTVIDLRTEVERNGTPDPSFPGATELVLDVLADVADRYDLSVINPPIPRTVRFAEASASGVSVLRGRKNKGAVAYRELAENLWKHWSTGAPLETFALDL